MSFRTIIDFIVLNSGYFLVVLLTILSTILYTIKTIYISRENVKIVLISNGIYVILNTCLTCVMVKNTSVVVTAIISAVSGTIGYVFGFKMKEKFDSSVHTEDKIWAIDVNVDNDLAKKFNEMYAKPNNIDAIYLSTDEWRYICGSKAKSKIIRNFVETYELPHIIQENFKWKNKKLSAQKKER